MIALILAVSLSDLWRTLTRETNSHAATARGVAQYAAKKYAEATESFARAATIAPGPRAAFALGTSQVAAGRREDGAASLDLAMKDPALRADALYNRGNGALAAKAYDYAIRDYSDALRLHPGDRQAKRNLEIALSRKDQEQKRRSGSGGNDRQGGQKPPQQSPGTSQQGEQTPRSDPNIESILRSVQQQEQEELSRMRKPRSNRGRTGW